MDIHAGKTKTKNSNAYKKLKGVKKKSKKGKRKTDSPVPSAADEWELTV